MNSLRNKSDKSLIASARLMSRRNRTVPKQGAPAIAPHNCVCILLIRSGFFLPGDQETVEGGADRNRFLVSGFESTCQMGILGGPSHITGGLAPQSARESGVSYTVAKSALYAPGVAGHVEGEDGGVSGMKISNGAGSGIGIGAWARVGGGSRRCC